MPNKRLTLMADFETTTDPKDVRVWASGLVDIETLEVVHLANSIESLYDFLKDKSTLLYYHNLRFDAEFHLSYLLTHDFKWVKNVDENGNRIKMQDKEFTTLITDDGLFYSLEVMFRRVNDKTLHKVTMYDSLKKLPLKVSEIARAFKLKMSKGEIDYTAPRPVGHLITDEEKDYIIRDCKIVATALHTQFDEGLTKMTNASDAMSAYKALIGNKFDRWFPVLPIELDDFLRKAYRGGYVYLKPEHKDERGLQGLTLDVNSLYPWALYYCMLPWGYPVYFEGAPEATEEYPLFIVKFKCTFELKPNHLPMIQMKNVGRFAPTEYLTTSRVMIGRNEENDPVELTLTSVDFDLFLDHYDVKFYKLGNGNDFEGYKFKGAVGMFKQYIDYWMHIKETTTGGKRQLAKLMLNSLYGRFAMSTRTRNKVPYLDEDNVVRYDYSETELRDPVYTALGAFCTAYAREKTVRSAQSVYDRFIYADTDSLHLIGQTEPENLEIHPTKLGAWKNEGVFSDSKYLRAKTYMETMHCSKANTLENFCKAFNTCDDPEDIYVLDGRVYWYETKVTCAGMPDNVKEKVTYDNFHSGASFTGKLMPRRYAGGIVLEETTFTIK